MRKATLGTIVAVAILLWAASFLYFNLPRTSQKGNLISVCTTLPNSVACTVIKDSSTEYQCSFITKGGLLFFHVLSDSGVPIEGDTIRVEYTTPFCDGIRVHTTTRAPLITNQTGWAVYEGRLVGNYSFNINNNDRTMKTILNEGHSTFVTIRIPSYNVTTVFEPLYPN